MGPKRKDERENIVSEADGPRFFEIVNWKKAQPRMKGKDNPWHKSYTSLLDCDKFAALDDASRVLIWMLWAYAARSGQYVFPADAKWLHRKIPVLNSEPDLRPLLETVDIYGNPDPWIKYCDPPKAKAARKRAAVKADREDQTREEKKSREEKKKSARRGVLSGNGLSSARKTRISAKQKISARKGKPDQADQKEQTQKPEPENPQEPDTFGKDNTQEPDALGRREASHRAEPAPGSDNRLTGRRRKNSPISAALYDKHDIIFGRRIHLALRLMSDPEQQEGYSEVTSFASVWHQIRQQLSRAPPGILDDLGMRAIAEARKIAKRKSSRKKAAVWIDTIRKIASAKT